MRSYFENSTNTRTGNAVFWHPYYNDLVKAKVISRLSNVPCVLPGLATDFDNLERSRIDTVYERQAEIFRAWSAAQPPREPVELVRQFTQACDERVGLYKDYVDWVNDKRREIEAAEEEMEKETLQRLRRLGAIMYL